MEQHTGVFADIDDWLIVSTSRAGVIRDTRVTTSFLDELGWIFNFEKPEVVPSAAHEDQGIFHVDGSSVEPEFRYSERLRLFKEPGARSQYFSYGTSCLLQPPTLALRGAWEKGLSAPVFNS